MLTTLCHRGMAYIYAKQALDHPDATARDDLLQTECVASLSKVVDYLHMSYEGGDMELGTSSLLLHYSYPKRHMS